MKRPIFLLSLKELLFLLSSFITNAGNSITFIVFGKLLFDITGLVSSFGFLILLQNFSSAILSIVAGEAITVFGARRVSIVHDIVMMIVLLVTVVGMTMMPPAIVVAIGFFLLNLGKPFIRAATFSLTKLVAKNDRAYYMSYLTSTFEQVGYGSGFVIAGVSINLFTSTQILTIDAVSYALAALMIYKSIDQQTVNGKFHFSWNKIRHIFRDYKETLQDSKPLQLVTVINAFHVAIFECFNITLFKFIAERFPEHPEALAFLEAAFLGGMIFGSMIGAKIKWLHFTIHSIWAVFVCAGLSILLIYVSYSLDILTCAIVLFSIMVAVAQSSLVAAFIENLSEEKMGIGAGIRGASVAVVGGIVLSLLLILTDLIGLLATYSYMFVLTLVPIGVSLFAKSLGLVGRSKWQR